MIKKIILWTVLGVFICLACILYIGYRSFNTEAFKEQITKNIQELTGRTFQVNGPYALKWDPMPTMTLENVSLSNMKGSDHSEMFKADKIEIQIEWASLFSSPTRIKNILITKPELLIERLSHSVTNINFPYLFAPEEAQMTSSSLNEENSKTQIDNIHIVDGSLRYINKMWNQDYLTSQLTGEVLLGSLSGPFRFNGEGVIDGIPFGITISLARRTQSNPIELSAEFHLSEPNGTLKLDGQIYPGDADKYLSGSISFDLAKPNAFLNKLNLPSLPTNNNENLAGSMAVDVTAKETALSDIVLKLGDSDDAFVANINYAYEHTSKNSHLKIDIPSLDANDWLKTLQAFVQQKHTFITSLDFDLTISNFIWNQQSATTLNLVGEKNKDEIQISRGSVLLPGLTTVQMKGTFASDFQSGQIKTDLQSQNFPLALRFFNIPDLESLLPIKKVKTAELVSTLDWNKESFNLTLPALSLDKATGSASYTKTNDQPTQITLELNHLNWDDYFNTPTTQGYSLSSIQTKLSDLLKSAKMPEQFQLKTTFGDASFNSITFRNLNVNVDKTQDAILLDLSFLSQNKDSLALKAQVKNFDTNDWMLDQNTFELKLTDLSDFLKRFNIQSNNHFVQNIRSFQLNGEWTGKPQNWLVDLSCKTQPYNFHIAGKLIDQMPQNMRLHFNHTSVPHLLVDLWGKNPFPLLNGEIVFDTEVTQQDSQFFFSDLDIQTASQHLKGQASYIANTQEINATLSTEKIDLTKFLPDLSRRYINGSRFDDEPFDFSILKNRQGSLQLHANSLIYQSTTLNNADLKIRWADNDLYMDNFSATDFNHSQSNIQVQGTFNFQETPTLNLTITTQELPLATALTMFNDKGLTGGMLSSDWHLSSSGTSLYQLATNLEGNGSVNLQNSKWLGINISGFSQFVNALPQNNSSAESILQSLETELTTGSSSVQSLSGNFIINQGIFQMAPTTIKTDTIQIDNASIVWNIPQDIIQAEVPLAPPKSSELPNISLTFMKDAHDASYDIDTTDFVDSVITQINRTKQEQEEAEERKRKKEELDYFKETKERALQAIQATEKSLEELNRIQTQTPNIQAQQSIKEASLIQQELTTIIKKNNLSLEQYQEIIEKSEDAQSYLNEAEDILLDRYLQDVKKDADVLLTEADTSIETMEKMYQKRPMLTLLDSLIQNSTAQRDIISRAIDQLQKNLSYTQVQKVFEIIQNASTKINKAHNYAQKIYADRQETSADNKIKRSQP